MADFRSSKTHVANCSKWSSCWCRRKLSTTRIPSTTYLRSAWSNGAAVSLSCDVENPEERVLHRSLGRRHLLQGHDESSVARLPSGVEDVLPGINSLDKSGFLRSWRCGRLRKRKIRNYFFTSGSPSPILTQIEDVEGKLNASGVTGAGRKVLTTQTGQEGPILFFSLFSFSTSTTGGWTDFRC